MGIGGGKCTCMNLADGGDGIDFCGRIGKGETCLIFLLVHVVKSGVTETQDQFTAVLLYGLFFFDGTVEAFIIGRGTGSSIFPKITLADIDMNTVALLPDQGTGISVPDRNTCGRTVQRCTEIEIVTRQSVDCTGQPFSA